MHVQHQKVYWHEEYFLRCLMDNGLIDQPTIDTLMLAQVQCDWACSKQQRASHWHLPLGQNGLLKYWFPIIQSMVGHPGSFFFSGNLLRMVALHFSVSLITSVDGNGLFLLRISLMYLMYVVTYMASSRGILRYNFWITSTNLPKCSSIFCGLLFQQENGR